MGSSLPNTYGATFIASSVIPSFESVVCEHRSNPIDSNGMLHTEEIASRRRKTCNLGIWSSVTSHNSQSRSVSINSSPTSMWWYDVAGSGGGRWLSTKKNFIQPLCQPYPGVLKQRTSFHAFSGHRYCTLIPVKCYMEEKDTGNIAPKCEAHSQEILSSQGRELCNGGVIIASSSGGASNFVEFTTSIEFPGNIRRQLMHEDCEDEGKASIGIKVHNYESLPHMQVQSPEEQATLAATPAHGRALHAMFASYVVSCFIERIWRFALPAIVALLCDSLQPVAVMSFVGQLVIFIAGPWVGELMDSAPRVQAFYTLSSIQAGSMVMAAATTIYALNAQVRLSGPSFARQPWFLALILASGVEKLTGLASGVAFERDWVVQLAGPKRATALARANAILRRVDLFCEIAGPLSFGLLLSTQEPVFCVYTALAIMAFSLPTLLMLVALTDKLSKGVLQRPKHIIRHPDTQALENGEDLPADPGAAPQGQNGFGAFARGWRLFLAQPVLPASIAYVLLFFNTVLGPGGLMTSFLTQRGLDVSLIGGFRGACAAMGFLATFISAPLISRFGVLKAGAAALVFQSAVLALAVFVFRLTPVGNLAGLVIFLALVVLSRLGLWTYDVVDAQIFQTAIPAGQANIVGTTEMALASLAELLMLAVAIVAHDVSDFGKLSLLSMGSVVAAAVIYCRWLASENSHQRRLFPSEPHFLAKAAQNPH